MFPPSFIDALKLSLLNEPIYHGKLTTDAVCAKLQNEGEFLIQDSEMQDSLLLSTFKDGVRDFLINIDNTEDVTRFAVGAMRFESLSDLTFHLKSVKCGEEIIRLGTVVYRQDNFGRFGAQSFIEEKPRVTMKSMLPLPEMECQSVVVALKKEIALHCNDEELETLLLLKHRHLISLIDFASYGPRGPTILRYQMHDTISLYETLQKESFIKTTDTIKWIHQAASLAYYLALQGCFLSILCAQDCYLDAGSNLKFRGAWKTSWPSWQEDTLGHAFYWRFVAPESLLYETHDDLSLMWNLGVFMWQLCTDCRLLPFFQHGSRQSFLEAILSCELELLNSERNASSGDLGVNINELKVPKCIRSTISSCVNLEPKQRCLWSDILNTCRRESTIASVGGIVKQIFPFL
uniref:Protein kinase domain-containing protein n=1 Tax=Haemonchus contortus TaxID=6289 RepID=A0A7I4Y661_HAECO